MSRAGSHEQCQGARHPRPDRRPPELGRQPDPRGARAQAVLTSILQTAKQQGKKPFDVLLELLCSRDKHQILDLVPVPPEVPLSRSPYPPPSFAVPDIIATLPSARLAAALSL